MSFKALLVCFWYLWNMTNVDFFYHNWSSDIQWDSLTLPSMYKAEVRGQLGAHQGLFTLLTCAKASTAPHCGLSQGQGRAQRAGSHSTEIQEEAGQGRKPQWPHEELKIQVWSKDDGPVHELEMKQEAKSQNSYSTRVPEEAEVKT